MASLLCVLPRTFKLAVLIIVAHGTGKWLLSSVGTFMHLKIATLVKSFFTFGTGKWFLFCVSHFMKLRVTLAKHSVLLFKGDH